MKNIFIEGLQGSGKSTLLEQLSRELPESHVCREGDYSPIDLAWCARMTEGEYHQTLSRHHSIREEILGNTIKKGNEAKTNIYISPTPLPYTIFEVIYMKQLKRYALIGIFFVIIAGTLAHFLYEWTGQNKIVGLFTPVNESVWEHMKLLFFPMLLYSIPAIQMGKRDCPCATSAFCFGILAGTALIPIFFYAYTSLLGKSILPLDIGIFVISTVMAFYVAYRLTLSCKLEPFTTLLCILVTLLALSFLLFTYHPPDMFLFAQPPF